MSSQRAKAQAMEEAFLLGLEDAQVAYEAIVDAEAWLDLGFDSFGSWWQQRIAPAMRALSMRPTREIAAAVVEKVREEEAELPPAQRRTQRELADMVGVDRSTLAHRDGSRSAPRAESRQPDLEPEPVAMPARQDVADAVLDAIDESTSGPAPKPELVPEHIEADARRDAELDEALAGTTQRFRATFATAMVAAGRVVSFDAERIAEVFDASFDRDVQRPFLDVLRQWCDDVEQAHRDRRKAGLRLVQGGAA